MFIRSLVYVIFMIYSVLSPSISNAQSYDEYVNMIKGQLANRPEPVKDMYDSVISSTDLKKRNGNMIHEYTKNQYISQRNITELVMRDNSTGRIFPGAMLASKPLIVQKKLDIVALHKFPTSLVTVSSGLNETLQTITHNGTYGDYITKISPVIQSIEHGDVRYELKTFFGKSLETVLLKASISLEGWGASISGSLSNNVTKDKSFALITFDQAYFTVVAEPESGGPYISKDLFNMDGNGTVLVDSFTRYGEPVVIHSVTYGRRLVVVLESDRSVEELENALNIKYNSVTGNVEGGLTNEGQQILDDAKMDVTVIGGPTDNSILRAIKTDKSRIVENLQEYLDMTSGLTLGVDPAPVSFSADYAYDRSQATSNLIAEFSGIIPRGSYPRRNPASTDIYMDRHNSKFVSGGDNEINSDDWTYTKVEYRLEGIGQPYVTLYVTYTAREGNHDKTFGDTRFVLRNRYILDRRYDRAIEKYSVPSVGEVEHWYRGERHGFQTFPVFGPFKYIEVSFDQPGRSDHNHMKLNADIGFDIYIGSD